MSSQSPTSVISEVCRGTIDGAPDVRVGERGSALIVALMAMLLLMGLGSALVLIGTTESRIAASYVRGTAILLAADGAIERAVADLAALADWDLALGGVVTSTFTDGAPAGGRDIGGTHIDLSEITGDLRCGRRVGCQDGDMNAFTSERPWGIDNPRWQLYAWGRLSTLAPSAAGAGDAYVMVWVADDPADADGDPLRDGDAVDNPGRGVIALVAHAYGSAGTRRVVEATVSRARPVPGGPVPPPGLPTTRLVSWRDVR